MSKLIKNEYFEIKIPSNWNYDDSDDILSIYKSDGNGSINISKKKVNIQIDIISDYLESTALSFSQKFIETKPFILYPISKQSKIWGQGKTNDNYIIDFTFIYKKSNLFLITYTRKLDNSEYAVAKKIINSFIIN